MAVNEISRRQLMWICGIRISWLDPFECQIFDLREFYNSIQTDKDLLEFYDWFYTINFPDIIFADKVILYEGDTERMLIKNALYLNEFESLRSQYVSYVQVGGAYAFNYEALLDFLKIKSAIITDLDYDSELVNAEDILKSTSTNSIKTHILYMSRLLKIKYLRSSKNLLTIGISRIYVRKAMFSILKSLGLQKLRVV